MTAFIHRVGEPQAEELAAATWPDVSRAPRRVLIVPLGATEQHGPHLPLDVDTRVARAVALGAAARICGAFVAPALPLGASGEHADFPGTLSIGTNALTLVLVELGRHASLSWPTLLFVNGHGGNAAAVGSAVTTLKDEGHAVAVFHCSVPGGDAHAGRAETSLMLHLAPEEVRLERAVAGAVEPISSLLPRLRSDGVRAVSPSGVLGDPAGASASEGSRLLASLVEECGAVLRELAPDA